MHSAREAANPDRGDAAAIERQDVVRRVFEITFGIALQVLTGILAWQYPPGRSVGSWMLYLVVGIVGLLGIIHGAQPRRRPSSAACTLYDQLGPSELPYHAKHCPDCSASLERVIGAGRRACPQCSRRFSLKDLGWDGDDPAGEPMSLPSLENRIDGRSLALAVGFVLIACLVAVLLVFRNAAPLPTP